MRYSPFMLVALYGIKKFEKSMGAVDKYSFCTFLSGPIPDSQEKKGKDRENSTFLKIAACIPAIGLVICQMQCKSIERKLKKLPLPKSLRPHPMMGNILDKNASPEVRKAVCERAVQLKSIKRDYAKSGLINNILTIALAVYLLAINAIPFFVGAIIISGFSFTAAIHTFVLYSDHSIKRYKKMGAMNI